MAASGTTSPTLTDDLTHSTTINNCSHHPIILGKICFSKTFISIRSNQEEHHHAARQRTETTANVLKVGQVKSSLHLVKTTLRSEGHRTTNN